MSEIKDLATITGLNRKEQKIIEKLRKERDKKPIGSKIWSGTRKASGGTVRLKSGGPVVDSYDYN